MHVDREREYSTRDDPAVGIETTEYGTARGRVSFAVPVDGDVSVAGPVDGDVSVVLGLEPSRYCGNGDHRDTHLRVTDFAVALDVDASTTDSTTTPASTDPVDRDDWETTTRGDASVDVTRDGIEFRVFRCSHALAVRDLGAESETTVDGGAVRVAFDYAVRAEGWHELPVLRVRDDDGLAYDVRDDPENGIDRTEYATRTGRVDATVPIEGAASVELGLEPSRHCENGDHTNTYFDVTGLVVEPVDA